MYEHCEHTTHNGFSPRDVMHIAEHNLMTDFCSFLQSFLRHAALYRRNVAAAVLLVLLLLPPPTSAILHRSHILM